MTDTARRLLSKARRRPAALPPLTEECVTCEGKGEIYNSFEIEEYEKAVDAAEAAYKLRNPGTMLDFYASHEYQEEWVRRQPHEYYGCEECHNYTGQRLTAAGKQIMDLVQAHLPK